MSQSLTTTISLDDIRTITREIEPVDGDGRFRNVGEGLNLQSRRYPNAISTARTVTIIATLTGSSVVSSFSTGLLTVCLPHMAKDLGLPASLLLWYDVLDTLATYKKELLHTI